MLNAATPYSPKTAKITTFKYAYQKAAPALVIGSPCVSIKAAMSLLICVIIKPSLLPLLIQQRFFSHLLLFVSFQFV
jgi:hypothetical protein